MSAYAIVPLPVVIDSTFVPDLAVTAARPARPSMGPAIASSGAPPTRPADQAVNADLVDLEPHWMTAVDAATD